MKMKRLNQKIIPKQYDTIKVDKSVLRNYARKQGDPFGKHWLRIINQMLKNSGNDTLYVSSVDKDIAYVSGWKGDAILGTAEIPLSAVKSIVKESKEKNMKRVDQIAKRLPPKDIKPGDYVELQGNKIKRTLNAPQILKMMKQTMNILYVKAIDPHGMMTLTPHRSVLTSRVLVPISMVRYKLTNVD